MQYLTSTKETKLITKDEFLRVVREYAEFVIFRKKPSLANLPVVPILEIPPIRDNLRLSFGKDHFIYDAKIECLKIGSALEGTLSYWDLGTECEYSSGAFNQLSAKKLCVFDFASMIERTKQNTLARVEELNKYKRALVSFLVANSRTPVRTINQTIDSYFEQNGASIEIPKYNTEDQLFFVITKAFYQKSGIFEHLGID